MQGIKARFPTLCAVRNIIFWESWTSRELMEDLLRDKVCLLRERIKSSGEGKALYVELSDLLLRAGKISAAMNILEKSFDLGERAETVAPDASEPSDRSPQEG